MNMLSAHINLRDVQPAASDSYFLRRNRQQPVLNTEYHNMQSWYTENHLHYADSPVFKECGFQLDNQSYIQCDKKIIKRLHMLWASPRWVPKVLSFTNRVDDNPTNFCSTKHLNAVLKACLNQHQFIILHVTYIKFIEHKEILVELAKKNLIHLVFSIGSSQNEWHKIWEPGTKSYPLRLKTMQESCSAGIPCGILIEPIIPGEALQGLYELLRLTSQIGIQWAGYRLWHCSFTGKIPIEKSKNYPNTSQMQLEMGFISQFTYHCKRFKLNNQIPNCSISIKRPMHEMSLLLF